MNRKPLTASPEARAAVVTTLRLYVYPATCSELARMTGLGEGPTTLAVKSLRDDGLIVRGKYVAGRGYLLRLANEAAAMSISLSTENHRGTSDREAP